MTTFLRTPVATEELARQLVLLASLRLVHIENRESADGSPSTAAIGEGEQLVFGRWYIGCQTANVATIDDAATVFGLALAWQPTVVLLATTGRLSSEATEYVSEVNRTGSIRFVALDDDDLRTIQNHRSHFRAVLAQRSRPDDARNAWSSRLLR